jgi:nickel transport system substrate-binding protein
MRSTALISAGLVALSAASEETTLTITAGTQTGFFQTGTDIGSLNPHDYRPNEFVTNDFIFEGLTAWDGDNPDGEDGVSGTEDDFVAPSLATSWTTNYASTMSSSDPYEITFTLRADVTFHDGSEWNAAAAKANFDQIMGGDGSSGGSKAMKGMHDWLGFTQSLDAWSVVDSMTFKLTFSTFYEAALRELSFIRPFRMISLASLPDMDAMEVSHNAWRRGKPRVFGGYTMRGVSNPIGTGPYQVISKTLVTSSGSSRSLPAADFNASCYTEDSCTYNTGETVSEVLFTKHAGHWKEPVYDNVIFKSYDSLGDVKNALEAGTLDIAYGVNVLAPSAFLSLATAEGSDLAAHIATTDLNTRLLVLNSGGRLNTVELRKLVMGILAEGRQALYDGELAEEQPMDTHFDPTLPYCGVLSSLSTPAELAATKSSYTNVSSLQMEPEAGSGGGTATRPLRFMYLKDVPHQKIIASEVIAALYSAGIPVEPMPVDKATYNARHCDYLGDPSTTFPYWYSYLYGNEEDNWHTWDIAYSETWGPPYDATSKLWDMTHGVAGWCSSEADAPAVSKMSSMDYATFPARSAASRPPSPRPLARRSTPRS